MKGWRGARPGAAGTPHILCVEPELRERRVFERIVTPYAGRVPANGRWQLTFRPCVQSAVPVLRCQTVAVVLCESRTVSGTWREMLETLDLLNDRPLLIVTSRIADESLWAEALNLGAYDVLAKPYDAVEVDRIVGWACSHWLEHRQRYRAAAG